MLVDKQPFDALDAPCGRCSTRWIHRRAFTRWMPMRQSRLLRLQNDAATSPEELLRVEWEYLPWLDRNSDASPKLLERRMATEPEFFCDVIRLHSPARASDVEGKRHCDQRLSPTDGVAVPAWLPRRRHLRRRGAQPVARCGEEGVHTNGAFGDCNDYGRSFACPRAAGSRWLVDTSVSRGCPQRQRRCGHA